MATPLRLLRGQAGSLRARPPWLARSLSSAHDASLEPHASSSSASHEGGTRAERRASSSFPPQSASNAIDVAAYLREASVTHQTRGADDAVELHELDAVAARAARSIQRRRRPRRDASLAGGVAGEEERKYNAAVWDETWRALDAAFTLKQLRQLAKLAKIRGISVLPKDTVLRKLLVSYVRLPDPIASSASAAAPPAPRAASKAAIEAHQRTLPLRRSEAWLFATQVPFEAVRRDLRLGTADAQVLHAENGYEVLLKAGTDEQLVRLCEWMEKWQSTIIRTTVPLAALFGPSASRPNTVPVRVLRDICSASDCFLTNETLESEPDVSGASYEPCVRIDALNASAQQRAVSLLHGWAVESAAERPLLAYELSAAEQELALPLHEPLYAFIPHVAVQPTSPLSHREGLTWRLARQYKAWELGNAAPPRQLRKAEEETVLQEAWSEMNEAEILEDAVHTREVHFGHLLYSAESAPSLLQPPLPGQWALSKALSELSTSPSAASPLFHPAQPPVLLSLSRSAHVPALDPNMGLGARKESHRKQLARLTYRADDGRILVVDVEQPELFQKVDRPTKQRDAAGAVAAASEAPPPKAASNSFESMMEDDDAPIDISDMADEPVDISDNMADEPVGVTSAPGERERPEHADKMHVSWRYAREANVLAPDSPVDMRLVSCAAVPLPEEELLDVAEALGDFVAHWSTLVTWMFHADHRALQQSAHSPKKLATDAAKQPPVPLSHARNPVVPSRIVLSSSSSDGSPTVLHLQSAESLSRHELVFSAATLRLEGSMRDGDAAPRAEASLVLPKDCSWDKTARLLTDILDTPYRTLRAR